MRKPAVFLITAVAAGVIIFCYIIIFNVLLSPENIKAWLKIKIETAIPASSVKIGKIDLDIFNLLRIEGLELKKREKSPFSLRVDEIVLNYGPLNLARGEVDKVVLNGIYLERNGRFNIQGLEGNLLYHSGRLRSEEFAFRSLLGTGKGWMELVARDSTLRLFLELSLLNLHEVSRSFYPDRIEADGSLRGNIWLKVKDKKLEFLQGEFNRIASGKINVKESEDLLSRILDRPHNQIDMLAIALDSMKDYQYEQGQIKLRNEGEDVVILFLFQGSKGKREFEFHWHTQAGGLK